MSILLDFDKALVVNITMRQGDFYAKVFNVTQNGAPFTWPDVTEIIYLVKSDKKSSKKIIELKKSTGGIVITEGQMLMNFPSSVTDVPPKEYDCAELLVLFSTNMPKLWWDGKCIIKPRAIKIV